MLKTYFNISFLKEVYTMKKKRIINLVGASALLLVLLCSVVVGVVFGSDLVLGATIYSDFCSFGGTVNATSYCQLADIT